MAEIPEVSIDRSDADSRYDIHQDGALAGFMHFDVDADGRLIIDHTEIDPSFSGRGLGTILVSEALADIAARGETIVATCSFVVKYVDTHTVPGLKVESAA